MIFVISHICKLTYSFQLSDKRTIILYKVLG